MLRKQQAAPGRHRAAAQETTRARNYTACVSCWTPGPVLCPRCSSWAATVFYLRLARSALAGTI